MEEVLKERLNWNGRFLDIEDIRYFNFSASGFSFKMRGKKAEMTIVSDSSYFSDEFKAYIGIYIWEGYDEEIENLPKKLSKIVKLEQNETKITLFDENIDKNMCIYVVKLTEAQYANTGLKSLFIDGSIINNLGYETKKEKIEVIGDSITCGYGVKGKDTDLIFSTDTESSVDAYPFLLARMMNADISCVSWSGIGVISHWIEEDKEEPDTQLLMSSLWPYTDRALCKRKKITPSIFDDKNNSIDTVIINLGTNDSSFVKDKKDRKALFIAFYKDLIERIHIRSPKARIICTYGVMEQSLVPCVQEAVEWFKKDFSNVIIKFVPLELQKEEDGIGTNGHPNCVTQMKIAKTLYQVLA